MTDTGRLRSSVAPEIAAILFAARSDDGAGVRAELELISEIDRAHLVMLCEVGLVAAPVAAALLREIGRLRQERFDSVVAAPRPRGLFLAYESELIERLGMDVGGVLHTGRSRNDLSGATQRLRARAACNQLGGELLSLVGTLFTRAREHSGTVMPVYTHYQVAMPITLGHYLLAVAWAALGHVRGLLHAGEEVDLSPLGAGAGGGTTLPIEVDRTASLLGFAGVVPSTLESVASRDYVLALLGVAAQIGVLLGRVATDLLFWTTEEVGFISLPDELVGSSSMMPQKRNPFVLEHVQGRSCAAAGAFVSAAGAMAGAPFTNSIAVGTEGTKNLAATIGETNDTVRLLALVITGMTANAERMLERAIGGYSNASAVAEALVESGIPFRRAHGEVGTLVRKACDAGRVTLEKVPGLSEEMDAAVRASRSPASVVERSAVPGGPSGASVAASLEQAMTIARVRGTEIERRAARWRAARDELDRTCAALQRDHEAGRDG